MRLFEEVVSSEEFIRLDEYISKNKKNVANLNARYLIKVNNKVVHRADYPHTILHPKDKISVYPLLGGG